MGSKYNNLDYIGKKYGFLTVISIEHSEKYKKYMWRCKCDCGKEIIVDPYKLTERKDIKSCGCYRASSKTGLSRKEYHREYMRDRRHWLRSHRFCVRCKQQDAFTLAGRQLCFECNAKKRKHPFEPIEEKIPKIPKIPRAEWNDYGLCSRCGKNPIKEGIRPYANVPYRVCEECYQHCLKMRELYKEKYGVYGIRYISPPTANTPNAIQNYRKLLSDQKERRRKMYEEKGETTEIERTC